MIIEAIGLPGSGKTFLFNKLKEKLSDEKKVYNFTELSRNNLHCKIVVMLFLSFISLPFTFLNWKKELYTIIDNELPHRSSFGLYSSPTYCVNYAILMCIVYRFMYQSEKVFLFDEGMYHNIVKLCSDFNWPIEVSEKLLQKCNELARIEENRKNHIVIYNYYPVYETKNSIKNRNRHVSLFDELSNEQLDSILKRYENYNEKIFKQAIVINRSDSIEKNLRRIISEIEER